MVKLTDRYIVITLYIVLQQYKRECRCARVLHSVSALARPGREARWDADGTKNGTKITQRLQVPVVRIIRNCS